MTLKRKLFLLRLIFMAVVQNCCCVCVYTFTHMHLNGGGNTPVVQCNISYSLFLGAGISGNEAGNSQGTRECNYPMSKFQLCVTIYSHEKAKLRLHKHFLVFLYVEENAFQITKQGTGYEQQRESLPMCQWQGQKS